MSGGRNSEGYSDPTVTIAISRADRKLRKEKAMAKNQNRKYMTTRVQYKAVKKYDHQQFDDFCSTIYREGYDDGKAAVPGADIEDVMTAIRTVKGIGEKRLAEIRAVVEKTFTPGKEDA